MKTQNSVFRLFFLIVITSINSVTIFFSRSDKSCENIQIIVFHLLIELKYMLCTLEHRRLTDFLSWDWWQCKSFPHPENNILFFIFFLNF